MAGFGRNEQAADPGYELEKAAPLKGRPFYCIEPVKKGVDRKGPSWYKFT
jgi:hypothetical protein